MGWAVGTRGGLTSALLLVLLAAAAAPGRLEELDPIDGVTLHGR
jgi:hypothetical protein